MTNELTICPHCGIVKAIIPFLEDGEMRWFCDECGWVRTTRAIFDAEGWWIQIQQSLALVDILESLLGDPDAARFLRPRLRGQSYLTRASLHISGREEEEYIQGTLEQVRPGPGHGRVNTYGKIKKGNFFRAKQKNQAE